MKKAKNKWFSENEKADNVMLTRKELMSEITMIAGLKVPLKDKMREIRYLVERYFRFEHNEESLNANLPYKNRQSSWHTRAGVYSSISTLSVSAQ